METNERKSMESNRIVSDKGIMKDLIDIIREKMIYKENSFVSISKDIGITRVTLASALRNERKLSIKSLLRIEKYIEKNKKSVNLDTK